MRTDNRSTGDRSNRSAGGSGGKFGPKKFGAKQERGDRPGGGSRFFRKKTCRLCAEKGAPIDFKDRDRLTRYLTEKGKIIPRRTTGNCAKCQRLLVRAIKRARHAAILAFQLES